MYSKTYAAPRLEDRGSITAKTLGALNVGTESNPQRPKFS